MSQVHIDQLRVLIKDHLVGTITRLPDDRTIFAFDSDYVADFNRPVLSLSFKAADGSLVNQTHPIQVKLLPFFSNLLPEGHLRTYLAEKLGINPLREFFLLAALGDDLPGAIRIEYDGTLTDEWNKTTEAKNQVEESEAFRFSLAGVQMKFSAVLENNGRITIPVKGKGGNWIVKLPAGNFENVPDAEFAMMTLAREAGIEVPEFKLVPASSIENLPEEFRNTISESFAVRRFDRLPNDGRVHMEDFAQVFGIYGANKYKNKSYANIAEVLWIEAGEESLREFVKRLVFNIAIGNGDMHLKNWSLLYRDDKKPTLSPAYDFIPTIAFMQNQPLGLSLGGTKRFDEITDEQFKRMAATARIPERVVISALHEAKEAVHAAWQNNKADLPLAAEVAEKIEQHLTTLKLFAPKPSTTTIERQPKRADRAERILGDVELDLQVDPERVVIESRSGFRTYITAPSRMKQWVLAEKILEKAGSLTTDAPVTALVNEKLYRQWRVERYITIPKAGLFTGELAEQSEHTGLLKGEFSPDVWRKISQAYKGDYYALFDLPLPNGSIRTFQGRILNISDLVRLESGDTTASLRLSVRESKLLLRPSEGRVRLTFREERDFVKTQAFRVLQELDWRLELFGVDHVGIQAHKKIPVAYNHQLIDAPFSVRVDLDFNGLKTVVTVVVNAEEHPLKDVSQDQALFIGKKLVELMKAEGKHVRQVLMPMSSVVATPEIVNKVKRSQIEVTDPEVKSEILTAQNGQEEMELVFPLDSVHDTKPIIMKGIVLSTKPEGKSLKVEFKILGPS
jgi:serine/threonine-protein kinase HipA